MQPLISPDSLIKRNYRAAFSLLELLIVVFFVSLFAFFTFGMFQQDARKPKKVTAPELRTMRGAWGITEAQLLCTHQCSRCYLVSGDERKMRSVETNLDELKAAYILDEQGDPHKVDFGRYQDEKICLRFYFFPNGSSSQFILESREGFIYLPSYFGKVATFNTLEKAADAWQANRSLVQHEGDFH